ncbi:hypothetical protein B0T25DRAFT_599857 [Lasiosphaeria hispida]|uniref:DUF7791 domain-containing protein n=1 Tax=Lasiosphaeria hispida TaxID=260671 RepID=A0AAJ0HP92_9PEZI|nr:hypothetical protein B0T25DRAFT_599857 [Lasiosphaeria hispida]
MKRLTARHPEECAEIMETPVNKSSGVFLWVVLACRSLFSGFNTYDRVSELRLRVDELPPELIDLFQQMLSETKVGMHTLGLALIEDYDNTSPIHIERLGNKVKRELCEELEGRLRSRCGGLLEVKGALKPRRDGEEFCLCGQHDSTPHNEYHIDPTMVFHHDGYIDSTVVFMHRTVFEFLSEEHVWELDCLRAPDNGLNLNPEFVTSRPADIEGYRFGIAEALLRAGADLRT